MLPVIVIDLVRSGNTGGSGSWWEQAEVFPVEFLLPSGMGFVPLPTSEAREAHATQKSWPHPKAVQTDCSRTTEQGPSFFAGRPHAPLPGLISVCCLHTFYLASPAPSE